MTENKFRTIYHQYYPLVKKVVYSILHDIDFSEDICQEVFISFSEKADTLEEEFYRQWFLVNAKRKAIDFCRKSYQVHEVASSAEKEQSSWEGCHIWRSSGNNGGHSVEDEITHKLAFQELAGEFFEDLAKKNDDWYEIVMRMSIEGEEAQETARALGISVENLRAKRHRIKNWINKYYRDKFEEL